MIYRISLKTLRASSLCATALVVLVFTLGANPLATTRASSQPSHGVILLGTVCDDDGSTPIPYAQVGIFESRKDTSRRPGRALYDTFTNRLGAFSFDKYSSPGTYEIFVFGDNGDVIASQSLSVTYETKSVQVLQLGTYRGSMEGASFEASGRPSANLLIVLKSTNDDQVFSAMTNKKGRYRFDHLPSGTYTLLATFKNKDEEQEVWKDVVIDGKHIKQDLNLKRMNWPE